MMFVVFFAVECSCTLGVG